jgi:hypothetical protein
MLDAGNYWLTRIVLQRALGLVYLIAFASAVNQFRPLLGEHGLLPVPAFIQRVPFRESPSLFYFAPRDWAFAAAGWSGVVLSVAVIVGAADRLNAWVGASIFAALWLLYLSFVNVGQVFYSFGWESLLLESGFFAMFLGAGSMMPNWVNILIYRWLLFRIMFGAGMIKLRGDSCWRDLTCLDYHYQSQPIPNPLSWFFHWGSSWSHSGGVLVNHFSELIVPFFYFLPQPFAGIAGIVTIIFQSLIMASGNLSWLNFLTIVIAIPTLDDRFFSLLHAWRIPPLVIPGLPYQAMMAAVGLFVATLSVAPIMNLLSNRQVMNTSFNPLHLVGTYRAFGGITRERYEIVIEGTDDHVVTGATHWREYQFKGKPGDLRRMPIQIAPYHLRLDWLMWFAAMSNYGEHPWFVNLMAKLLHGDPAVLRLMGPNPFSEQPPRFVRAEIYLYQFTTSDERRQTGNWWKRQLAGRYFPAVSLQDPAFVNVLHQQGWE